MKKYILLFMILFCFCSLAEAKRVPDMDDIGTAATNDLIYVIDVSDTSDSTDGTGKKATIETVIAASSLTGLSDVGSATATAGRLLVSDGDSWESVSDVYISPTTGSVGIGTTSPGAALEVVNSIILTPTSSENCIEGNIYYDSDDKHFKGCNDQGFINLDNYQTIGGDSSTPVYIELN